MTRARTWFVSLLLLVAGQALAVDSIRLPEYRQVQLENGVTLVLIEKHDVPLVSFSGALRGGLVSEAADKNGEAALLAELLLKGAGQRDAVAFAEAVDAVGGEFSISAATESIRLRGEFMARDAGLMVGLLADVLRRPRLDQAEFDKIHTRAVQSLAAMKDSDPRQLITTYGNAFLFQDHPYARSSTGSEASLGRVAYADVRRYAAGNIQPGRLVLVVSGDFDSQQMLGELKAALADWQGEGEAPAPVAVPTRAAGSRVLLVHKPGATQSYFWIGNLGLGRGDPGEAPFTLVNTLYGGRFTSMLNTALRIESGLTYGARSNADLHSQPGALAISSYTATATTVEAVDLALAQLTRLREQGLDAKGLRSGKTYLQGLYPLRFETAADLADQVLQLKLYGLPDSRVNGFAEAMEKVSDAQVAAVIRRLYLAPEDLVYVFIGDADTVAEQLGRYGSVTRMDISDRDWLPAGSQAKE